MGWRRMGQGRWRLRPKELRTIKKKLYQLQEKAGTEQDFFLAVRNNVQGGCVGELEEAMAGWPGCWASWGWLWSSTSNTSNTNSNNNSWSLWSTKCWHCQQWPRWSPRPRLFLPAMPRLFRTWQLQPPSTCSSSTSSSSSSHNWDRSPNNHFFSHLNSINKFIN